MKLHRLMGSALALVLVAASAQAQSAYPPPPPVAQPYAPPASAVALYAAEQLDQMLAPVALYPDPLLTQILAAATYPGELDEAARWRAAPGNAMLTGPPLAAMLQAYDWDPSVKSLVPFPQILQLMDEHLDWTEALGNAFLAQQADVMDSIQRLRHQALAAGTLASSPYASVLVNGPYIQIEPVSPQIVYVPVYDPTTVYGAWAYPAYPPVYYGPPPGLDTRALAGGIGFVGIGIVDVLWNWGHWDWRHHDVHVDRDRFNRINHGRKPIATASWHHDPDRRDFAPSPSARSASFARPQQDRFHGAQLQASLPPAQLQQRRDQQPPQSPHAQERHAPPQAGVTPPPPLQRRDPHAPPQAGLPPALPQSPHAQDRHAPPQAGLPPALPQRQQAALPPVLPQSPHAQDRHAPPQAGLPPALPQQRQAALPPAPPMQQSDRQAPPQRHLVPPTLPPPHAILPPVLPPQRRDVQAAPHLPPPMPHAQAPAMARPAPRPQVAVVPQPPHTQAPAPPHAMPAAPPHVAAVPPPAPPRAAAPPRPAPAAPQPHRDPRQDDHRP